MKVKNYISWLEIEWKFIYVGNSQDARYDQELDTICMNQLSYGTSEFDWEVNKGLT